MPPSAHQVPDQRLDQIMDQLRSLQNENSNLRGQINMMAKTYTKPESTQQTPQESPFDPEVDKAINDRVNQIVKTMIEPLKNDFGQQIGYLVDRNDELSYNQKYGNQDRFTKLNDKVQQLRDSFESRGEYITRENALQMVYFEETGKKPAMNTAPPTTPEPKFDPYFNAHVNPETGKPMTSEDWGAFEQKQPTQPEQGQTTQQFQPPAQQFQQPEQPAHTTQHNQQTPQLPDQSVNSAYSANQQQSISANDLNVYASDEQLAAFEDKFGDIPL